jgi:hypothetical protein
MLLSAYRKHDSPLARDRVALATIPSVSFSAFSARCRCEQQRWELWRDFVYFILEYSTRIYLQEPDKYGTRITAVPVLPPDVVGLPSVQRTSPQELVQRKHSEAQFRFWSSTSASLSGSRTAVRDEAWYAARLPLVRGFTWRLS